MSELADLIARLQRGIDNKAAFIKTIKHPRLLIASLKELLIVIGNEEVKDSVATQISHSIVMKRRALENPDIKEDQIMMNIIMEGSPGLGKTFLCTILAKIYYALGYLKGAQNNKEDKKGLGDMIKGALGQNNGSGSSTNDDALALYIILIFIIILVTFISLTWSFYEKFGGTWTIIAIILVIILIIIFGFIIISSLNSDPSSSTNNNIMGNNKDVPAIKEVNDNLPVDNKIIKIVSRADFVDKYVGWTAQKTLKLLNESLGKVLFVDEAYSLINGPHDEFGMEALTTLNLFMSEHPNEIIIIFAGYKDLIEAGPFSVQPGLKSRFMWQFECTPYNAKELYQIFKLQLKKKGWGLTNEKETEKLFEKYHDVFLGYGRDTERTAVFAEIEHSRDFIADEQGMSLNLLTSSQVERGILKLKKNNFSSSSSESQNPLANMMKMMANKKFDDNDFFDQSMRRARH
jgi:hypothetical protein